MTFDALDMTDALGAAAWDMAGFEPGRSEGDGDGGTGTAVLERPETKEETKRADDGDADRYAHYVSKDRIRESKITGRPVVALCGKVWVPRHDPAQYPVCPDCQRIYDEMMR